MPLKSKRTYRRKPYVRRRSYRRKKKISLKPHVMRSIPDRLQHKFKYCETIQLDPSASGVPNLGIYKLNSLYDPSESNTTGTVSNANHQPAYLDTFDDIYSKYRVYGCKWIIKVYNMEHQKPIRALVRTLPHTPNASIADDLDALRQQPNCQYAIMTGRESSIGAAHTFKGYTSIAKIEGVKNLTTTSYEALMSSDPTFIPTLAIYTQGMESTYTYSASVYVDVTLIYYAELFDRNIKTSVD